jgi:hypothetical protein
MAVLASAIVAFCWTAATSNAGIIVFSIAYGFTSGAILSQQISSLGYLARGDQVTAPVLMGVGTAIVAGPCLAATPVAGALVDRYGYLALSMFVGAVEVVGAILLWCARLSLDKRLLARV